jgi:hypothetical protein
MGFKFVFVRSTFSSDNDGRVFLCLPHGEDT